MKKLTIHLKKALPKGTTALYMESGQHYTAAIDAGIDAIAAPLTLTAVRNRLWYDVPRLRKEIAKHNIGAVVANGPKHNAKAVVFLADNLNLFPEGVPIIVADTQNDWPYELVERLKAKGYTAKRYTEKGASCDVCLWPEPATDEMK